MVIKDVNKTISAAEQTVDEMCTGLDGFIKITKSSGMSGRKCKRFVRIFDKQFHEMLFVIDVIMSGLTEIYGKSEDEDEKGDVVDYMFRTQDCFERMEELINKLSKI